LPGELTEITEISTALGILAPDLPSALATPPTQLRNVSPEVWDRLVSSHDAGQHRDSFVTAFANGQAFLAATDGLRGRAPRLVEWKGPHRPPGDDVIPADLRVDHVYLVSCKYLSKVLLNPGPPRLFDRLLLGEERSSVNWFAVTAPTEFQAFYQAARSATGLLGLPADVIGLTSEQQLALKAALRARILPTSLQMEWRALCQTVAAESERRWRAAMPSRRSQLRLLWRLLRISTASYFVLGTDRSSHLRLRVDSAWDWMQAYSLNDFVVSARSVGQAEVAWHAAVRKRDDGLNLTIDGHVEVRWSHGRFNGFPEAKVYLDTALDRVPGYNALA